MFRFAVSQGRTLTSDYSSINRLHHWTSENQIESRNLYYGFIVRSSPDTSTRSRGFYQLSRMHGFVHQNLQERH